MVDYLIEPLDERQPRTPLCLRLSTRQAHTCACWCRPYSAMALLCRAAAHSLLLALVSCTALAPLHTATFSDTTRTALLEVRLLLCDSKSAS